VDGTKFVVRISSACDWTLKDEMIALIRDYNMKEEGTRESKDSLCFVIWYILGLVGIFSDQNIVNVIGGFLFILLFLFRIDAGVDGCGVLMEITSLLCCGRTIHGT